MRTSRRTFLRGFAAVPAIKLGVGCWPGVGEAAAAEEAAAAASQRQALADAALATAGKAGASYADIRLNRYRTETISTSEQRVQLISAEESYGAGVRVLVNGIWGFAATSRTTTEEIRKAALEAVAIAKANAALQRKRVELAPVKARRDSWNSGFQKNPFDVPLESKIGLLLKINATAQKVKGASFVDSSLHFGQEVKYFVSTEGCEIEQDLIRSEGSFNVTAVDRSAGQFQERSSLAAPRQLGWEYIEEYPSAG